MNSPIISDGLAICPHIRFFVLMEISPTDGFGRSPRGVRPLFRTASLIMSEGFSLSAKHLLRYGREIHFDADGIPRYSGRACRLFQKASPIVPTTSPSGRLIDFRYPAGDNRGNHFPVEDSPVIPEESPHYSRWLCLLSPHPLLRCG